MFTKARNLKRKRSQTKSNTPKYSSDIDNCNLWQFKQDQKTGETRYLYKLKKYDELPEKELLDQWYDIYEQWSEVIGGNINDLSVIRNRRMIALKHLWNVHASLLRAVATLPVPEMIEIANEEGFNIDINNLEETLKFANGRLQRRKAQIEIEEGPEEKQEKADFDGLIIELEKFQGYEFNEKKMTVRKFANIYKKYKEHGKRQNKKKGLN